MVKCASSLLVQVILALSLSACSGVKPSITAERPGDESFHKVLKKEMSSLNVSIEASSSEISKALNQAIHKELYKGLTKTRGLTVDLLRNGPIAVSAADNYLYFTLPIIHYLC